MASFRRQAQRIVSEAEWDTFIGTLRAPIPTTFRVAGHGTIAKHVQDKIRGWDLDSCGGGGEGKTLPTLLSMGWYPNQLAWQLDCPNDQLRKSPTLAELRRFIVQENEVGNVSRQEAVSMLPALLLNVRPTDCVLDLCAAPGSKTMQLLELLDANGSAAGMVVANDADFDRCLTLVHQAKRADSACLVVTHHDARAFPSVRLSAATDEARMLQFDRVLCDVPCSGDGILRKTPEGWRKWTPERANGLHFLQRDILVRGLQLLRPGGTSLYWGTGSILRYCIVVCTSTDYSTARHSSNYSTRVAQGGSCTRRVR